MKTKPGNNTIVSIGICSALAASLCCITPVLAFIAGASGLVATFAWIEPARPLLIGVTLLILGFAWYQKLKPGVCCACVDGKTTFFQSYIFLGLVTQFIGATLTFPYYTSVFYPETTLPNVIVVY